MRYAGLLRAVNVGGRKGVAMADLRAACTALGFTGITTLLQSGNVVFDAGGARDAAAIARRIETELRTRSGLETIVFVRDAAQLASIVDGNPFANEARDDPGRLVAVVLDGTPRAASVDVLRAAIVGPEQVAAGERVLYAYYPAGQGTSKLTLTVIEKKLGVRGTARNWNTIRKIAAAL